MTRQAGVSNRISAQELYSGYAVLGWRLKGRLFGDELYSGWRPGRYFSETLKLRMTFTANWVFAKLRMAADSASVEVGPSIV